MRRRHALLALLLVTLLLPLAVVSPATAQEETAALAGRVLDPDGAPVAGATVRVSWRSGDADVQTDADGAWRVEAPSERRIRVLPPPFQGDARRALAPLSCERPCASLDLTLPWAIVLQGRVLDPAGRPVAGALVLTSPNEPDARDFRHAFTDAQGSYRLLVRPSDAVRLQVDPPREERTIPVWLHREACPAPEASCPPLAPRAVSWWNVTLPAAAMLRGEVLDPDGRPARGVIVRVTHAEDSLGGTQSAQTDPQGRFLVKLLPGNHSVLLERHDDPSARFSARCVEGGACLEVRAPETNASWRLPRPAVLEGIMRRADGAPAARAEVILSGADVDVTARSDESGAYRVRLPPGRFVPTVRAGGPNGTMGACVPDEAGACGALEASEGGTLRRDLALPALDATVSLPDPSARLLAWGDAGRGVGVKGRPLSLAPGAYAWAPVTEDGTGPGGCLDPCARLDAGRTTTLAAPDPAGLVHVRGSFLDVPPSSEQRVVVAAVGTTASAFAPPGGNFTLALPPGDHALLAAAMHARDGAAWAAWPHADCPHHDEDLCVAGAAGQGVQQDVELRRLAVLATATARNPYMPTGAGGERLFLATLGHDRDPAYPVLVLTSFGALPHGLSVTLDGAPVMGHRALPVAVYPAPALLAPGEHVWRVGYHAAGPQEVVLRMSVAADAPPAATPTTRSAPTPPEAPPEEPTRGLPWSPTLALVAALVGAALVGRARRQD